MIQLTVALTLTPRRKMLGITFTFARRLIEAPRRTAAPEKVDEDGRQKPFIRRKSRRVYCSVTARRIACTTLWQRKCSPTGVTRSWSAFVCSAFVFLRIGVSAETKAQDPLNRESPQSSVYSFLEACHSRNYQRAWRYLNLRNLPEAQRLKGGPQLAQQLEQILDHDVRFDVASLSRNPEGNHEHVDSF